MTLNPYPNEHPPKRFLWDVLVPALESHFGKPLGPTEWEVVFDAIHVCKHDFQCFFAPRGELGKSYSEEHTNDA